MLAFIACLVVAGGGLGVIAGALLAGPASYERGWDARGRHQCRIDSERHNAGFRVIEAP